VWENFTSFCVNHFPNLAVSQTWSQYVPPERWYPVTAIHHVVNELTTTCIHCCENLKSYIYLIKFIFVS
jgi:hypothetical protein